MSLNLDFELHPRLDPLLTPERDAPDRADRLMAVGVPEHVVDAVEEIIEHALAMERISAGAVAIQALLSRLGNTENAWAVLLAVYGEGAEKSLADAAAAFGITKQSMAERVGRVKKR